MCGSDKPLKASKREARSKINIPIRAFWKTTRSIGGRCTRGNAFSRAVLIRLLACPLYGLHDPPVGQARQHPSVFAPASYHYVEAPARKRVLSPFLRAEGFSAGAPPVPIPNTAVTPRSADGTALRAEA